MYTEGKGVPQSSTKAHEWYQLAADSGHTRAQRAVGLVLCKGNDAVARDPAVARTYLEKAADKGDAPSQNMLALLYCTGDGADGRQDMDTARLMWHKAARQGNRHAQCSLALLCWADASAKDVGNAMEMEIQKVSMEWMQKSAKQGCARAQYNLGHMHYAGVPSLSVAKNDTLALQCFRQAADQEYFPAERMLGTMYYAGEGCARDVSRACALYAIAAAHGDAEAQFMLGYIHYMGADCVEKDPNRALSWFERSACARTSEPAPAGSGDGGGIPDLQANGGGTCDHNSRGAGHVKAQVALGIMHTYGTTLAFTRHDSRATRLHILARALLRGPVQRNEQSAKQWLQRAVDQGHEGARLLLEWDWGMPVGHDFDLNAKRYAPFDPLYFDLPSHIFLFVGWFHFPGGFSHTTTVHDCACLSH